MNIHGNRQVRSDAVVAPVIVTGTSPHVGPIVGYTEYTKGGS